MMLSISVVACHVGDGTNSELIGIDQPRSHDGWRGECRERATN
jgi:hypothetical protein